MKTFELKDICGYLPYGLKVMHKNAPQYGTFDLEVGKRRSPSGLSYYVEENEIPILRPMSNLTKEITHKGDRFVPIVEFIKQVNKYFKWDDSRHKIEIGDSCILVMVYSRPLDAWGTEMRLYLTIGRLDKLSEWMFDYRGLIEAGLAIDANTLPENPYEKEEY